MWCALLPMQVSDTVSAQPIMTPLWAAPEVVAKQPASIKADMWSYGEYVNTQFYILQISSSNCSVDWPTCLSPHGPTMTAVAATIPQHCGKLCFPSTHHC